MSKARITLQFDGVTIDIYSDKAATVGMTTSELSAVDECPKTTTKWRSLRFDEIDRYKAMGCEPPDLIPQHKEAYDRLREAFGQGVFTSTDGARLLGCSSGNALIIVKRLYANDLLEVVDKGKYRFPQEIDV